MLNKTAISLIQIYKKNLSPLKRTKCPYYPSCSEYALQAFKKYGFIRAFFISAWRLIRCNPLSKGGFDPLD